MPLITQWVQLYLFSLAYGKTLNCCSVRKLGAHEETGSVLKWTTGQSIAFADQMISRIHTHKDSIKLVKNPYVLVGLILQWRCIFILSVQCPLIYFNYCRLEQSRFVVITAHTVSVWNFISGRFKAACYVSNIQYALQPDIYFNWLVVKLVY